MNQLILLTFEIHRSEFADQNGKLISQYNVASMKDLCSRVNWYDTVLVIVQFVSLLDNTLCGGRCGKSHSSSFIIGGFSYIVLVWFNYSNDEIFVKSRQSFLMTSCGSNCYPKSTPRKTHKSPYYCFLREIQRWAFDSLHIKLIMRKTFPHHDGIIYQGISRASFVYYIR